MASATPTQERRRPEASEKREIVGLLADSPRPGGRALRSRSPGVLL